ncbi:hypothetical protein KKF34_10815 [Myxococcota bacterium]|nr:hypothetical protein [Myxococcota bacterium]MBU1382818.1 hypothetical protein [Myxococcota bacterium]MBU1497359.1 hypothetical protein [Myxococcota bacterium]
MRSDYPWKIEPAFYKLKINDVNNPQRNHPLHDSATVFSYAKDRFHIAVTFDGVSESREKDKDLVNISRELEWDLESYCRKSSPEDIHQIADWFKNSINNEKYSGMGATTISLLRFDCQTSIIDGICVGDSPAAIGRSVVRGGEEIIEAQILTALHSVANDPGIITRQWKYGKNLDLTVFSTVIPQSETVFLVTLSDGYGKLSDKDVVRLVDDDLQDSKVAVFFPDFARVYLPGAVYNKFPELRPDCEKSVSYYQVSKNPEIMSFLASIYDTLTPSEKKLAATVDLDTNSLFQFYRNPGSFKNEDGDDADTVLSRSHPALAWMLGAPYNDARDETGLDDYLREYIIAELFIVSMLEEVYFSSLETGENLQRSLKSFFDGLGPIADDFSVAMFTLKKQ